MSEKLEQLLESINNKIDQLLARIERIELNLSSPRPDPNNMVYGPGAYNPAQNTTPPMPSPTSGLAEQINKMREELMGKYMKDGKPIMPEIPSMSNVPGGGAPGVGMGGGAPGMPGVPGVGMPGMPDLATNMAKGIADTMKRSIPKPDEAENVKIKEDEEENV